MEQYDKMATCIKETPSVIRRMSIPRAIAPKPINAFQKFRFAAILSEEGIPQR